MNLYTFTTSVRNAFPIGETQAIVNRTDWAEAYVAVNKSILGTLRVQYWNLPGDIEWIVQKLSASGTVEATGKGESLELALESFSDCLRRQDEAWVASLS